MTDLGVQRTGFLVDGSGLSRDQIPARTIGQVLNQAARGPAIDQLWPVIYNMPIAGFTGTLATRFVAPATKPGRARFERRPGHWRA